MTVARTAGNEEENRMKIFRKQIRIPALPSGQQGFSLIELMIAVAILAIIVTIAVPSYRQWVLDSNRAEGKALLMQTAQALERCFTRFSSYTDGNCAIQNSATIASENQRYNLTVTTTANTFSLTAAPVQADPGCGSLTLTHTGARSVSGSDSDCW